VPGVIELHDQYVAGKRSHGFGRFLKNEEKVAPEPVVTCVAADEIDRFIGAENLTERLRHLRRLRDEGLMICQPGGLQAQMRRGEPRAYVFRCQAHDVPRVGRRAASPKRTGRGRVGRVHLV
jgi:hypothetical protein